MPRAEWFAGSVRASASSTSSCVILSFVRFCGLVQTGCGSYVLRAMEEVIQPLKPSSRSTSGLPVIRQLDLVERPLSGSDGTQAIQGEIDAFTDADAGVTDKQEGVTGDIVTAQKFLMN